ncbi:hypothetical protein BVY03_01825 [bacterium K02(2017)]|nr:hypothetical protein BVY03_01825 [bacterium K02(2017)]
MACEIAKRDVCIQEEAQKSQTRQHIEALGLVDGEQVLVKYPNGHHIGTINAQKTCKKDLIPVKELVYTACEPAEHIIKPEDVTKNDHIGPRINAGFYAGDKVIDVTDHSVNDVSLGTVIDEGSCDQDIYVGVKKDYSIPIPSWLSGLPPIFSNIKYSVKYCINKKDVEHFNPSNQRIAQREYSTGLIQGADYLIMAPESEVYGLVRFDYYGLGRVDHRVNCSFSKDKQNSSVFLENINKGYGECVHYSLLAEPEGI